LAVARRAALSLLAACLLGAGGVRGVQGQSPLIGAPSWSALTPAEKQVLAPLAGEWDRMDAQRRLKWLGIARRYHTMKPEEQQRIRTQMQAWAKLTPEQRQAARERYRALKKLPPEKRGEVRRKWEEYQNLPPERRRELAAQPAPPSPNSGAKGSPREAAKKGLP
jgi:hypothetical protein